MTMGNKVIPAGEFKARCLALLDEVARTGGSLTVSKRGRPVAQVVPAAPRKPVSLRGSVRRAVDLVAPTGETWEAG
jgi:prevent-host-death family protein